MASLTPAGGGLNGKAAFAICVGMVLVWSGVKGWSVFGTIGDLVKGQKPSQANTLPLSSGSSGSVAGSGGTFAEEALQYQGHAYLFGGAPGGDGSKPWDCSSFVNYVIGVRFGQSIPGYGAGKYDGSSHGPATGQWAIWNGLSTISRDQVAVNDILVWAGHMGIAISAQQYVSALNPTDKTAIRSIDGQGRPLRCGRYVGVA